MGKCSFRSEWFKKKDDLGLSISKWAKKGNKVDEIFCLVCVTAVKVTKGYQAVVQHYSGKKHKDNVKTKLDVSQCHLAISKNNDLNPPNISQNLTELTPTQVERDDPISVPKVTQQGLLQLVCGRNSASRAEIVWALVMITNNFSAQSCQDISAVFHAMFPGAVPEGFSLSPKKFSYIITEALGPYFRELVLKEAQKEFFPLQFDETTNNKGKKELQVIIKFWSNTKNEVVVHHLQTIFIGSATAEVLSSSILSALAKGSLSLKHLITVGSDGPAVNHKVFRLLNEETIAVRGKGLLSVGTCNLHHINNAFLKGLEAFSSDVPDLVIAVYYFFHGWPSRQEEYAASQKLKKVPQHAFIKHVSTRWLTLKDAADRLLEHWPAVQHYFLEYLPRFKSLPSLSSYSKIASLLKTKSMKAQLYFVISSAHIFSKYSTFFQKEEPLIHVFQTQLNELLLTLTGRVCKRKDEQALSETSCLDVLDNAFSTENLLSPKDIEFSQCVEEEVRTLSERDQLEFRIHAQKHYAACGQYLLKKSDKMLKIFSCLQPSEIPKSDSCKHIVEIAKSLPEIAVDILLDEWKLLQTESVTKNSIVGLRIDQFWREIFKLKNCSGHTKYPVIEKFVKMSLSISHDSADVERGFSLSSRILSEEHTTISEQSLNARLNVMDGLKQFNNNPTSVLITIEMLTLTQNANRSYMLYCEEQKRKEESERKKVEKKRKREAEEEENKIKAKKMKADIENMKEDLKEARMKYKEKKEIREKLFEEVNKRLKMALTKGDIKEINLAQGMMEGVDHLKSEETELEIKVLNLEKSMDMKTSNLISKFVKEK